MRTVTSRAPERIELVWKSHGIYRVRVSHLRKAEERREAVKLAKGLNVLERKFGAASTETRAVESALSNPQQLEATLKQLRRRYRELAKS